MRRPSLLRNYCRFCRVTTEHTVTIVKKRTPSELSRGQRKFRVVTSGYGGFPRPKPTPKVQNPVRRANFLFRCNACQRAISPGGVRARRAVIVRG